MGSTNQDDRIMAVTSSQLLRVYLRNNGGWQYPDPTDSSLTYYDFSVLEEGWHHIGVVVSGSGGSEKMDYFIDGSKVATLDARTTTNIRYIGNLNTSSRYSIGNLDEFAFFNSALSDARMLAHYQAGKKGSCGYRLKEGFWYHIAGHIDDSSETVNLYLNGQLHCSESISGISSLAGSAENLRIGRSPLGAGTSWAGQAQSLTFYSSGGASEILNNYNASRTAFNNLFSLPPSGLRLWLKADSGLYTDAEKTTAASSDGDFVVRWEDFSGNGGDVIADDDADNDDVLDTDRLPKLRTGVINGLPVLEFDGVDDFMANYVAYGYPNTVFLVARYMTDSSMNANRGRVLSGASNNWLLGFHDGQIDRFYANGWVHNPNVTANESWHIYAADHSNADVQRFYRNDTILQSNSNGSQGPRGLGLGGYRWNSQLATCQVAEVIVFDRVLTDDERSAVFDYLNTRYGVY
ncbi:MAG: hypothetical protein HRU19_27645 [Pseudobacteriovorax sp.]|nr:hypothetical protein [Pseudobacteriovorax sp.]